MKRIKILCSFDDGSALDMTLANLLLKYRIPTIFYIPVETADLTDEQIKCLSGGGSCQLSKRIGNLFEIGAHTMTHPVDLKRLDDKWLAREIADSKARLELIVGKPVTKFCYPRGRFDERVKKAVRDAGFREARTTRVMSTDFPKDRFETNTSVHVHPSRKEYGDRVWKEVAEELLEEVLENGGRFEIFGHSWEIEEYNQWEFLEDFLWYMNEKMKEIKYPRDINEELKI